MTERLAETTRRIGSVHALSDVVTAMRGISASRVQQAHGLLEGVRAYEKVIANAIGQALPLLPEIEHPPHAPDRQAVIVFCAEQGFAGAFSDRVLDTAAAEVAQGWDMFLIGTRGAALARDRGMQPFWQAAMVPHASLISNLAGRIADALYAWVAGRAGSRLEMIVPHWKAGEGVTAERRSLLPFDFRRFASPLAAQAPLITLPPWLLLVRLAEEYIFSELCEAALSAFSAENEARVAIMLSAKAHLDSMLSDLQASERQIRQEEITAEVVELASSSAVPSR
ncbi:MAG TPA: FoF1 ATP synthase subunit gamma [Rhodopila sp.]|uniref:F0F1 ATP synthase subunit gamma n=1 Tax=Rhodopila sp. TaxID=2480087 RepID=UPI002CDA3568|nr:FoF1 ATP synthase subunit gamma [Rhodopila sp.]HVY14106.1 FoF1 ATP synthase subunit gamma [Rhodopila sp.]